MAPTKESLLVQAHVLAIERRPEACLGCGFEYNCSTHGCAVIDRLIQFAEDEEKGQEP